MKQTFYPETNMSFNSIHNNPNNFLEREKQSNNLSPEEQEEILSKIYEDNIELITNISKFMQVSELCSLFSFLLFLIILEVKLSPSGNFNWFYVNIPFIFCMICVLLTVNMFLYLKELFEIPTNPIGEKQKMTTSSLLLFIIVNSIGFLVLLFIILLSLTLNKTITLNDLNIIFIPLYVAFILLLACIIFFTPAFIYGSLYTELCLLFISILSAIIFCILLCIKENSSVTSMKYLHVFIPIYFTLGAVLLFLLISSLIENQNTKETKHNYSTLIKIILYGIGIIFISSAIVTLQVKLDYTKDIKNHYIEVIVGMIGYIFICINNILNMFCSDYINEEENGD